MGKYIDADKLKEKIDEIRQNWIGESTGLEVGEFGAELGAAESILDSIDDVINSLQQEQPEVDLEREIDRAWEYLEKDYSPSALDKSVIIVSGLVGREQFSKIAKYFFELGPNVRK